MALIVICAISVAHINAEDKKQQAQLAVQQLAANQEACNLDSQQFLNTVNQWREAKGVAPLQYSTQLQSAAQARVADMMKYQYYGHLNPVTHIESYTMVQQIVPAATSEDEVIDAPNKSAAAFTDFKNSSDHFNALTNGDYNYFGIVSEYIPEQWAEYDNTGKLLVASGHTVWNCVVVGELANNINQKASVNTVTSSAKVSEPIIPSTSGSKLLDHQAECTQLELKYSSEFYNAESSAYQTYLTYSNKPAYNQALVNAYQTYSSEMSGNNCSPTMPAPIPL
jgi:hypothetical protein